MLHAKSYFRHASVLMVLAQSSCPIYIDEYQKPKDAYTKTISTTSISSAVLVIIK